MSNFSKTILVDADGVLLNWESGFDSWMSGHGFTKKDFHAYNTHEAYGMVATDGNRYCQMFNESVYIKHLKPFKDSIKYVKKLHDEHNFVFHVITSISDNPYIIENRVENLHNLFGESTFSEITCLGHEVSKASVLDKYKNSNCFWIEDVASNYLIGRNLGLKALLVDQNYNQFITTDNRMFTWYDIYNRIVKNETLYSR